MPENRKLRFAVLVDGPLLKKWQSDSIQHVLDTKHAEFVGFIQNTGSRNQPTTSVSLGFRYIYKKIDRNGPLQLTEWEKQFPTTPKFSFTPESKGIANFFNESDLEALKMLELDVVIRFGFGILKGEVLSIPTYGIWSFHHGNPRKYRGGPAAFWEIFEGNSITGSILQQLNEKLDQGQLIREGFFQTTNHSYQANLYHVLEETAVWPALAVKAIISHPQQKLALQTISEKGKLYKVPGNFTSLRFIFNVFLNKVSFHLNRLFRAEKWNVGRVNQPIEELINKPMKLIKWLNEAPSNSYYADPFTWKKKEVLLELYNYKSSKGSLKKLDTNSGKLIHFLDDKTHYSYPFSIQHGEKRYVLPENYKNNLLQLHEVDNQLNVLQKYKILEGPWIDPTLFQKDGKWWLSCVHASSPKENLYLFYANSIEGPYNPHLLNPVLTDIRSSRPAGTPFLLNEKIIRPTQNCSKTYGGSVVLKQIDKLSPTEFEESFVKEILPQEGRYSNGLHTLSTSGEEILVDGKRYYFNFWNFWNQLKASFNKQTI
tara:strand:+ start:19745 stop:21367 length:1623 start_codon:yes stop_codon:yes gene_type:complete